MGALYLASKLEECPLRMRDLINVYDLLLQRNAHTLSKGKETFKYAPMSYFGNTFYDLKDALVIKADGEIEYANAAAKSAYRERRGWRRCRPHLLTSHWPVIGNLSRRTNSPKVLILLRI